MIITQGKYRGITGEIHQFCNDWLTVRAEGVPENEIFTPTQIQLTDVFEFDRFDKAADAGTAGTFFDEWELKADGRFLPRQAAARS